MQIPSPPSTNGSSPNKVSTPASANASSSSGASATASAGASATATNSASSLGDNSRPLADINDLALKPNKRYEAKVVQTPSESAQTKPQTHEGALSSAAHTPQSKGISIVQLNGQYLAIDSPRPLAVGQTLSVQVVDNGSELALKVIDPALTSPQARSQSAGQVGETVKSTSLAGSTAPYPSQQPLSAVAQLLLTGIGKALPNQLSLRAGLELLSVANGFIGTNTTASPLSSQALNAVTASELGQISQLVRSNITAGLTGSAPFEALAANLYAAADQEAKTLNNGQSLANIASLLQRTNQTNLSELSTTAEQLSAFKNSAAFSKLSAAEQSLINQALSKSIIGLTQQTIENTGQWFEAKLLGDNKTLSSLKQFLGQLPASSSSASTGGNAISQVATGNPSAPPGTIAPANSASGTTQSLSETLAILRSMQSSTSHAAGTPALGTSANTLSASSNAPVTDLKQTLLHIVSALSAHAGQDDGHARSDTGSTFAFPNDLIKQPLNFPHLPSVFGDSTSLAKASSALADTDLSLGLLLKLAASMLNRVQLTQLNNLFQNATSGLDSNTLQSWFFELPLQQQNEHVQVFQIRIDQQKNQTEDSKDEQQPDQNRTQQRTEWKINLAFDLPGLGPLNVQASFLPSIGALSEDPVHARDETRELVRAVVWCRNEHTRSLVESEKQRFVDNLKQIGVTVEEFNCHVGKPPDQSATLDKGLVDVQA